MYWPKSDRLIAKGESWKFYRVNVCVPMSLFMKSWPKYQCDSETIYFCYIHERQFTPKNSMLIHLFHVSTVRQKILLERSYCCRFPYLLSEIQRICIRVGLLHDAFIIRDIRCHYMAKWVRIETYYATALPTYTGLKIILLKIDLQNRAAYRLTDIMGFFHI